MSEQASKFLCPLPWVSLSLGSEAKPRLCCHYTNTDSASPITNISEGANLNHTAQVRQEMLEGRVPKACSGCKKMEESQGSSPRTEYLKKFPTIKYDKTDLQYLDLTFDNICNLQCVMCSPYYSRELNKVFKKLFSVDVNSHWSLKFDVEELNSILPKLKFLTLTGGEPFVSPNILGFLRFVAGSGFAKHIVLRLYSNLSVLPADLENILKSFSKVELFLSVDSVEENYEWIRYPAKWKTLTENIKTLKQIGLKNLELNLHAVVMAENWLKLPDLLDFYYKEIQSDKNLFPAFVELTWPQYLRVGVLPEEQLQKGLIDTKSYLKSLPHYPSPQLLSFENLLNKISENRSSEKFIDYMAFKSKISKVR